VQRRIAATALSLPLVLAGAALLAGCGHKDEPMTSNIFHPTKKKVVAAEPGVDPAVTEANRTMIGGVALGAGNAPLDVRFALATAPAAGAPFTLDVAVLPQAPAPVLRIDVRGSEGLSVTEPAGSVQLEKVEAGTVQRFKVIASSVAPGTRVVSVKATLELPTGAEAREYAYPIVVGPPAPAAPAAGR
jgi:hypothetical protein